MDNYIRFYNIPYDSHSFRKPYFVSDAARDNFFNKYSYKAINKIGVNINVGYDYIIIIKADIDVVYMDSYNFAIVQYNDRKYYCDIVDYSHISVNRTEVILRRNVLFEITNYLAYYTDFSIRRVNYDAFDLTVSSPISERYSLRYVPTISVSYDMSSFPSADITFEKFLILFINRKITFPNGMGWTNPPEFSPNTLYKNYYCVCLPFTSLASSGWSDVFNAISPYIISAHVGFLPTTSNGIFGTVSTSGYFQYSVSSTLVKYAFYAISTCNFNAYGNPLGQMYYDFYFEGSDIYGKLVLYFMSLSNKLELNISDYVYESGRAHIRIALSWIFNTDCVSLRVNYESLEENTSAGFLVNSQFSIFNFIDATDFMIDSEAEWHAQNRYYNAITSSLTRRTKTLGAIGGATDIISGLSSALIFGINKEIVQTPLSSLGLEPASEKIGFDPKASRYSTPSVIRGVGEIASSYASAKYEKQLRELEAKNAQAAPDSYSDASNGIASLCEFGDFLNIILLQPYPTDYEWYSNYVKKYGVGVTLFKKDFVPDGEYFILEASAYKRNEKTLTATQNYELNMLLNSALYYDIIKE